MLSKKLIDKFRERYPWTFDIENFERIHYSFNPHDPYNTVYAKGIVLLFSTKEAEAEFVQKFDGTWEPCPVYTKTIRNKP